MQFITPAEAAPFLGERAVVIEGTSFILYDTHQFMAVSSIPHFQFVPFFTFISITIIGGAKSSLEQFECTLPCPWFLGCNLLFPNPRALSFLQVNTLFTRDVTDTPFSILKIANGGIERV